MDKIKVLILISQLGRVWSRGRIERKLFQSMTAIGFFALFLFKYDDSDKNEFNDFNNTGL